MLSEPPTMTEPPALVSAAARAPRRGVEMWPILGLASLALFWPISVALIPAEGYDIQGGLVVSGWIMTLGLLLPHLWAAIHRPSALVRPEMLLVLGVFYWVVLDAVQAAYDFRGISQLAVIRAFHGVGIFAAGIWLGCFGARYIPGRLSSRALREQWSASFLFYVGIICFFLGMARVLLSCSFSPSCFVDSFFVERKAAAWYVSNLGNFDTLLHHFRLFGFLVPPLLVALYHTQNRRVTWRQVVLGICAVLVLALMIREGGRRAVGMVVIASGLVWLFLHARIERRHLIQLGLCFCVLLLLMQAMVAWRYYGIATALVEGRSLEHRSRSGLIVDTNLRMLGHITQLVPDRFGYTGGTGIYAVLVAPFPKSIVKNKPAHRGFNLPRAIGMRVGPKYTWTCSAIGDLYLIGGFFAIFVGGLMFGAAVQFCGRLLDLRPSVGNRLVYGVTVMVLFLGLRALHDIVLFGLALGAIWAIMQMRKVRLNSDTRFGLR